MLDDSSDESDADLADDAEAASSASDREVEEKDPAELARRADRYWDDASVDGAGDDDGYQSARDEVVPEGMIMGFDDEGRFVIEDGEDSDDSDEDGEVAEFHDA